ncbi:MAG: hypothetical protein HC831_05140 [Chloroflexia bacterium]|nr:hypothetical protein [Chloroflexia bacterium]
MRKSSIRTTLLLVIIFGVFLPIIILIVVSGIQYKRQSEEIAKNRATMVANEYSSSIERILNESFTVGNVYADVQSSLMADNKQSLSSSQLLGSQIDVLKKNKQILAMYTIYLPGRIINPNTGELNETLSIIGNTQYKGNISELINWEYEFKSNVIDSLKKRRWIFFITSISGCL